MLGPIDEEQLPCTRKSRKVLQNMRISFLIHEENLFLHFLRYFFMLHSSFLTVCGGVTYDTGDEDTECDHQLVHCYQDTPKKTGYVVLVGQKSYR